MQLKTVYLEYEQFMKEELGLEPSKKIKDMVEEICGWST